MKLDHIPHPDEWRGGANGMSACFHQTLSRWAHLRAEGDTRWWVAVGVVNPTINGVPDRHLHAWLESGDECITANGFAMNRDRYHHFMDVERHTVRLLNPRGILRKLRNKIDRTTVDALLKLWGLPYTVNDQGGIIPADKEQA